MERAAVPCGGCTLCCRTGDAIALFPDKGDKVARYKTHLINVPGFGMLLALDKGPDGKSCIYLKGGRCSIWEWSPIVCQSFDCRRWYLSKTRAERRRLVRSGWASQDVFNAGRERLSTLPAEYGN